MLHKQDAAVSRSAFVSFCVILVAFALSERVIHAQPAPMLLTVNDSDGTDTTTLGKGHFDFGDVDPMDYSGSDGYILTHSFTLWNNSQRSITVSGVRCRDSRSWFDLPYVQRSLPIIVPKDDYIFIQLHYRLFPLVVGEIHTSAEVIVAHQESPAAILLMDAHIKEDVVFTPPSLDFGRVTSGQEASQVVKVVYSPQMYSSHLPMLDDRLPFLASDKTFITVKRVAVGSSRGPQTIKFPGAPGTNGGQTITVPALNDMVSYLVTVKADAPVGVFQSIIWVMPKTGTFGSEVLKTKNIRVQGEIVSKQP